MNEIYNKAIDFLYSLLLTLVVMLKDVFFWIIEGVGGALNVLIDSFAGIFDALNLTSYIAMIPASVLNVMTLCGIDIITSMIVTSLLLRMTLQLIPFTRLGS